MADQWLMEIGQYLKTVSRMTPSLTARGNSTQLIKKVNSAKSAVKAQTKISRGLLAIEQLKNYDLVYNHELKDIIKQKKLSKTQSSKYKEMTIEAKKLLKKYPSELESFLGAIERLEKGGLDCHRQCLSSCRNCIENLVKKISGENDWKLGLNSIVSSKTKQRIIKMTYGYLSAYGSHGPESPTEDDAKTGIEQTMATIRIIISAGGM